MSERLDGGSECKGNGFAQVGNFGPQIPIICVAAAKSDKIAKSLLIVRVFTRHCMHVSTT